MRKLISLLFVALTLLSCNNQPKAIVNNVTMQNHPRLLYTKADSRNIGKLVKSDEQAKRLETALIAYADTVLNMPDRDDKAISLGYSRDYVNRYFALGMAYRQTGDKKYADKINQSLIHVCSYENWHPAHYLDVAEMTTAVAVAYDWFYDVLPAETKALVKQAIMEKALNLVIKEYKTGGSGSWAKRETNWNVVCNAGMILGALAIAEDYPEIAGEVVTNAVKYMPNCLSHYSPDGVCYEGSAYYEYTNIYLAMCLKALNDNFGNDLGLSDIPGVSNAARYYVHTLSPTNKILNFADTGMSDVCSSSPLFFFFSRQYNQPDVASWYRKNLKEVLDSQKLKKWHFPLALAWYDNAPYDEKEEFPSIETFHNINDILVLRGKSTTPRFIHLIAKGGDPDMAHQQADGGSFVVETEGVRWFIELGCDSYDIPRFFTYEPDALRWTYFRESSLSHNTINIDDKCQHSRGTAHFSLEDKESAQPSATFDMTTLYPATESTTRRFKLLDDQTIEITDNVVFKEGRHDFCWSAVTDATITTDGNTAILEKQGKRFMVKVTAPANAVFTTCEAKPFTKYEKPLDGITMLQCRLKNVGGEQTIVTEMQGIE